MESDSRDERRDGGADEEVRKGGKGGKGGAKAKDAWKERRRKPEKTEESKKEAAEAAVATAAAQVLSGGALLSMLKANPPGATRYSREELLSIGQLPASKVRPAGLNSIIDKENSASPLLVKARADKDDYDDDGGNRRARGTRPAGPRRGESDDDEDADRRRGRKGQQWADRWKEEERQPRSKADEPQWDMPDVAAGNEGNLLDFTLGDIRKAEKSISGGMSMKDYKASLRAGVPISTTGEAKESDDLFRADAVGGGSSLFVEEDEDVSRASRGFGKWFGSRGAEPAAEQEDSPWDMPPVPSRPAAGPGSPAPPVAARGAPSSRFLESPGAPAGLGSVERLLAEDTEAHKEGAATANVAGRSILSMLSRPEAELVLGDASVATGLEKKGKLDVAQLFHLAQGQELPPIPGKGDSAEDRAHREALRMAALARKGHPSMPNSRFPGYQQPGGMQFGAVPPALAAGRAAAMGKGAGMPRGPGDHYPDSYQQAMLDMSRGFPGGCPPFMSRSGFAGYAHPPYSPYPSPGFPHPAHGAGFGSAAQAPGVQLASALQTGALPAGALQAGGYGRLAGAAAPEGAGAARPKAHTALGVGSSLGAASALGSSFSLTGVSTATTSAGLEASRLPADRLGADEGNEEDAGCSQS